MLFQLKRTTAVGVPETGGLGSGHDAVSESEVSGPLELRASLMMYDAGEPCVVRCASRLSFTDVLLFITRMNALAEPADDQRFDHDHDQQLDEREARRRHAVRASRLHWLLHVCTPAARPKLLSS